MPVYARIPRTHCHPVTGRHAALGKQNKKKNVSFAKFPFQSHKPHIAPKIAAMNIWYVDKRFSLSVVSNSLRPHGLQPTRLLCPWDYLGKNTGVGCHFLLQGIFPSQGSNPGLLHWQGDSLPSDPPRTFPRPHENKIR